MQRFVQRFGAAALIGALALVSAPALADQSVGTSATTGQGSAGQVTQLTALGEPLPDVATAPRHMETATDQIIGGMTVIGRAEIERKGWRTLSALLENAPGLHIVQAGGFGQPVSYFLRGTHSDQALVLIDSVEIHDPAIWSSFGRNNVKESCDLRSGPFFDCMTEPDEHDVPHILTDNIERVEIMRGPIATYGPRAVGGVINIVTRKGSGPPSVSAYTEAGAYNTFHQNAGLHGGNEMANYSVSYSNMQSNGLSALDKSVRGTNERDGYSNDTWSARLGLTPADGVELNLMGRRVTGKYDLDHLDLRNSRGFINKQTQGDGILDGGLDDVNNRARTTSTYVRGETVLSLMDNKVRQTFGASWTDHDRKALEDEWFGFFNDFKAAAVSPFDSSQLGSSSSRMAFDAQTDIFLNDQHTLTIGLETERESIDTSEVLLFGFGDAANKVSQLGFGEEVIRQHGNRRTNSVFAQHQFNIDNELLGSFGVRLDDNDEYGSEVNYRAAAAYAPPGTGTRFHASIGTAMSEPPMGIVFGESASGFGILDNIDKTAQPLPNGRGFFFAHEGEDLEPEKLRGLEVGVTQSLVGGKLNMGSTYFWARGRNNIERIDFSSDEPNEPGICENWQFGYNSFAECMCESGFTEYCVGPVDPCEIYIDDPFNYDMCTCENTSSDFSACMCDSGWEEYCPVQMECVGPPYGSWCLNTFCDGDSSCVAGCVAECESLNPAKTSETAAVSGIGLTASEGFYRNQGKTRLEGFESFVSYMPNERMLMRLDHTFLTAEDRSTNMDLLSRPKHQLNASLEVRPIDKATLSTTFRYVGKRKDLVDNSLSRFTNSTGLRRTTLGGFGVVNLAGTYQLTEGIRLFGRIDNLLQRNYQDTDPWSSRGFSGYLGIRGTY
jgi:vitamin B12 transporter